MFPRILPFSRLHGIGLCSLGLSLLIGGSLGRAQEVKLAPGDLIAICGDSITEQRLYSADMEAYFLACQPVVALQATQFGWGGETAGGFLARMDNDALGFRPNVATLCYGMNDGGYVATDAKKLSKYKEDLDATVKRFKAAGARGIVVGTPGAVDTTTFKSFFGTSADVYNQTLADFGAGAKEVAQQEGVGFADLHGTMLEVMAKMKAKYGRDYTLSGKDGIHPDANGHLVMVYAFLKALGCPGDVGTLTFDLAAGSVQGSAGHRVLAASKEGFTVESTKYPFCFTGDPAKTEATSGVPEFLPFNQDLNRFVLVVKNAPAGKLKVTWGEQSREFDTEELAKGVNLAAEFTTNPFSQPFVRVLAAVGKQQRYETTAIKEMLHNLPDWQKATPAADAAFETLRSDLLQVDAALRAASAAAVQPVRYEVKVAAVAP